MKLARLISSLLHPIIMPLFGLYVIFHSGTYLEMTPPGIRRMVYIIVFVSNVLLPLSFLPLLKFQRIISDFGLTKHNERVVPLLFTAIFYYFGYYLLQKLPVSDAIHHFQLAAMIAIFLDMLLSIKWKISLHMTGMGGFLGLILALAIRFSAPVRFAFIIAVLAAGLLAYSRLRLNVHKPSQVYAGLGLGFFTVLITILMY